MIPWCSIALIKPTASLMSTCQKTEVIYTSEPDNKPTHRNKNKDCVGILRRILWYGQCDRSNLEMGRRREVEMR